MSHRVDTLLVVGLGLIGGSLVAALRDKGFARRFMAFNRSRSSLEHALAIGLIDEAPQDLAQAVAAADLIVVGVPTLSVEHVFETIRDHGRSDVVVTDVASVKASVIEAARRVFGRVPPRLVAGHPIAGAEKSGVQAASAALFERHRVILTPLPDTDAGALATVNDMWRLTGAEVVHMDVHTHDRILAMTSHLPHMLAFALVDSLAQQSASEDIFRFAAGGFRDFTRIASSDVVMWRDIALANHGALLDAIDGFTVALDALRSAVAASDADTLEHIFRRAHTARERYLRWLEEGARQ